MHSVFATEMLHASCSILRTAGLLCAARLGLRALAVEQRKVGGENKRVNLTTVILTDCEIFPVSLEMGMLEDQRSLGCQVPKDPNPCKKASSQKSHSRKLGSSASFSPLLPDGRA